MSYLPTTTFSIDAKATSWSPKRTGSALSCIMNVKENNNHIITVLALMFLIVFSCISHQYNCSDGLTSALGPSWGTKATLKWVQKRVPDSQPLPSLAVSFFLTMTALWSTHSPSGDRRQMSQRLQDGIRGYCSQGVVLYLSECVWGGGSHNITGSIQREEQ